VSYEYYKEIFSRYIAEYQQGEQNDEVVVSQHQLAQVLSGLVAGSLTVIATNPLDVVKTRLQTQHVQFSPSTGHKASRSGKHSKSQPKLYSHSWEALRYIAMNEGIAAFGKGLAPRLMIASILSPVASVVYELVLQLSRKTRSED